MSRGFFFQDPTNVVEGEATRHVTFRLSGLLEARRATNTGDRGTVFLPIITDWDEESTPMRENTAQVQEAMENVEEAMADMERTVRVDLTNLKGAIEHLREWSDDMMRASRPKKDVRKTRKARQAMLNRRRKLDA